MPNQFDRIFKENIEALFHFFAAREGVKIEKSEEIKDKIQATVEREADFVRKIIFAKKSSIQSCNLSFNWGRVNDYHISSVANSIKSS
jgi:hypothetical protein